MLYSLNSFSETWSKFALVLQLSVTFAASTGLPGMLSNVQLLTSNYQLHYLVYVNLKFISCHHKMPRLSWMSWRSIYLAIDPLMVLIEYVPHGDLLGYLRKSSGLNDNYFKDPDIEPHTNLTSEQLMRFAWQVADGMMYLSSIPVSYI